MDKQIIPDFLYEMSKQLNTQNNRFTADPLFEVRYKDYLITERGYNEHHQEVITDDGDILYRSDRGGFDELAEYLFGNHQEWCIDWCAGNDFLMPDDESKLCELFVEYLDIEWEDFPSDLKVIHLQEVEVTVNSHLTEKGAKEFIQRKQHDYPPLYTYVISMVYCWDMIELRNWIKQLTEEK